MKHTQLNKHYVFILFLLPLSSVKHCIHISMLKGTYNQPDQAAQNYKTQCCRSIVEGWKGLLVLTKCLKENRHNLIRFSSISELATQPFPHIHECFILETFPGY